MNEYSKVGWINGSAPPLSAENLNHMDDGIEAVTNAVIAAESAIENTYSQDEVDGAIEDYVDLNVAPTLNAQSTALTNHNTRLNTVEQELGNKLDDEDGVIATNHIQNGAVTADKLAQSVQNTINGKADKTNKVFKAELLGVLMPAIQGGLPNVDTANNTLTLPKDMSLLLVSSSGSSQTKALSPNGDVVISYPSTSSAVKIYYDLTNEQFHAYTYDGVPSQNDVLICTIRDTSAYGISNDSMSISCPFTIDGKLFGVNLADYIANNSITEAQLSTAYKLSVQNSIDEISTYASGINSNVNSLKRLSLINLIKSATFEKGALQNGAEIESTTRIRSAFINISDVRSLQVSANSGYKYSLHFYDSTGTFVSSSLGNIYWHWVAWQTESYFIPILPAVKYVRIVISDTSNSENITLNDSSKIKVLADYSEYRQFQFLNNYCGKLQESEISHNNWVNAATDGGSGLDYSSTRICSGLIELPESGTININTATGYKACYAVYNENMVKVKGAEYSTSCTLEIGNNHKWIVVFVKIDSDSNVDISPDEGSNCTISYIPTDNIQCVENIATSVATSAATNVATNAIANAENIQHIDDIVSNSCVDISWEYGILWQNAEGDGDPPFTRIRSGYIPVGKGTRVRCAAGYQHIVFKFDLQKKWISNPNWTSNEIVVDQDCLIRITVAKLDNSVINESEINTVGNSETIIRELPQYIADNVLDFSDRIPSYYNAQLKAAINSVTDNIVAAGINGESFVFFSDTHWEGNAKWSPALIKEIVKQTNINTIFCGGDLIEGGNKATMVKTMNDFISRFKGVGKFFVAYGNHDGNTIGSPSNDDHLTKGETYALAQKQSDFDVQYGNLCYYYFDNPTTKTRFIVLDTGINQDAALDSTQRTWFQTTLNNMPNNYHALIFAHIIYVSDNWRVGMSALEFNRTDFMDEVCTICDTFNSANNGKKVEAMFGGHTHFDLDPTLDTNSEPNHVNRFTSTGGIPIIIIDCDTVTTASADGQGNRDAVRGTITEQCFDIVTVDYGAKKIECVRIGRGSDRTISYSEGE